LSQQGKTLVAGLGKGLVLLDDLFEVIASFSEGHGPLEVRFRKILMHVVGNRGAIGVSRPASPSWRGEGGACASFGVFPARGLAGGGVV